MGRDDPDRPRPYDRGVTPSRWPASVYDAGDEPDPRFSLANERTFLAWIRTSLALLAGAVAVDALPLGIGDLAQGLLALLLALTALFTAVHAWRHWARTERAMRTHARLPGNAAGIVVTAGVAVAGVVVLGYALWGLGS